jgi:hypothetical protein
MWVEGLHLRKPQGSRIGQCSHEYNRELFRISILHNIEHSETRFLANVRRLGGFEDAGRSRGYLR